MDGGRSIPWGEISMRFKHKVPTPLEEPPKSFKHKVPTPFLKDPPKSFKHKVSPYDNDNSLEGLDLESSSGDENSLRDSNLEMSSDTILLSPPHFFSSTSVTSSISSWSSDNRPQYVSPTHSLTHSPSISRSCSTSPNITMIPNNKSPMDIGENNMGGNSCVPFVWEESPGKSAISTWKQLQVYDEVSSPSHSLKLPPKLLAPSKREPCRQEQQQRLGANFSSSSSSSLVMMQRSCLSWKLPKNHKLLRLCKSLSSRSTYPKVPLTTNTTTATTTTTSNTWGVPMKLFQRSKSLNARATMATKTKKPDIADDIIIIKDAPPRADANDVSSVCDDILDKKTHARTGRPQAFIRHGELKCIQTHHKLIKLCKTLFNSARSTHFLLHHHPHSHNQEKKVHTVKKQSLHDMNSTSNKRFFFEKTEPTLVGLKVVKPKMSPIALAEEKLNVERIDAWLNSINLHGKEEAIFSPVSTQYSEPSCSPDVWKCSIKFDESQPSSPKRMQAPSMDGIDHVSLSGVPHHGRGGTEQEDSDDDGHDLEHRDNSSDSDHCDGHGSSHDGSQVHGHGDDHGGSHGDIHGHSDSHRSHGYINIHGNSDSHGQGHGHGDSQGHDDSHGHGHATNMSISSDFSCQTKPSFIITSSPCKSYNVTHDDDDNDEMSPRKKVLLSILSMVRIRNKFGKVIKLTSPKITHMAPTPTPPKTTTKRTSATSFSDIEVQSTMNSPWILDLGPDHEMKKDGCKVHYMLSSTQLVKLKNIVVRKVSFKKGKCNEVYNNGDMWSPSLATYLYNQQKEKEGKEALEENNDSGIMSVHSTSASFRLHLDRIPLSSTRNQSSPYNIDLW